MAKARMKTSTGMTGEGAEDEDVEVITPASEEQATLLDVERLLSEVEGMPEEERPHSLALLGPGERKAFVTPSLYRAVLRLVRYLAHNRSVAVGAANPGRRQTSQATQTRQLTTTQAATMLGVSRPYLIKLLDSGQIPSIRVGTKRRIAEEDLLRYKRLVDAERIQRRAALDRLIEMSGETDIDFDDIAKLYAHRHPKPHNLNQDQAKDS
jgi:excisionase family DNA binding protein